MSLQSASIRKISVPFEVDANFKIQVTGEAFRPLFTALTSLGLGLHFLSDERKIITDLAPAEERPSRSLKGVLSSAKNASGPAADYLEMAIQRAVDGIRKQAIAGSGVGEVNANIQYADIARRIVSPYLRGKIQEIPSLTDLINDLKHQAARSVSFARFGLSTELPADDLLPALQSTGALEHAEVLHQIMRPFVDGFKLRLDALEPLHDKISTFVETVNAFYQGKSISFQLGEGIVVTSEGGEILNPSVLSSGEKQLLLLFCNILAAGDRASIFIIDEPELSLNVKWQRKLVDALLECTRNTHTQFVLATHSLELLTQHQHNVLQLSSRVAA